MKPYCIYLSVIACFIFCISCHRQPAAAAKPVFYYYIYDFESDGPTDSLKAYSGVPWEESLELYTDTDTLDKTVSMMVHMGIFKLNGQRFAVITDTTGTAFYKFNGKQYKRIFKDVPSIAFMIDPMKFADYNKDGYTDVLYAVSSGGSYGDDCFLLFYDPKTKSLIYNEEPELRNAEIHDSIVRCGSNIWATEYVIAGNKLWLYKDEAVIQTDTAWIRKSVITYNKAGLEVRRDTLPIPEDSEE